MCFVLASLIYSFFYMTRPSAMFPIKIYMRRQSSCVGLLITFSFPFWSCLYFLQLCNIQVVITRNIVCSPCSRGGRKQNFCGLHEIVYTCRICNLYHYRFQIPILLYNHDSQSLISSMFLLYSIKKQII